MAKTPIVERQVGGSVADRGSVDVGGATDRKVAFRRLAEEHLDASYGLASAILGDPSEARDAVHDAFVTAWRKWDTLRDPTKFEPWFQRVVVNTCRNRLRRSSRHPTFALPDDPHITTGDQTSAVHDHQVLDHAFADLSANDQIVLILRYFLDLAADDIARLIDVKPGSVGSRLNRAQARMRVALTEPSPAETAP